MAKCEKCILTDKYPGLYFDEKGVCSLCKSKEKANFTPIVEEKLLAILTKAKNKNKKYDALVPLSGGKDSIYMLYLAVKKYKLKVLAMTYDNGFMSDLALKNIKKAVAKMNVSHVFYKTDEKIQKKVYKAMLKYSGDFCGACDIATIANILKASADYDTPLILYGTSPLEEDSFLPDDIQDLERFKYIMKKSGTLSKKEINKYLIYPNMNYFMQFFYNKIGKFGKKVLPFYYFYNPSDYDMGEIIKKEMDWEEPDPTKYTKHFDCIAEPFTNYIRHKIYGYERHICQYSTMVRNGEISRNEAEKKYKDDAIENPPKNILEMMDYFDLTDEKLKNIFSIKPLQFEKYTSKANKLFAFLRKIKEKL